LIKGGLRIQTLKLVMNQIPLLMRSYNVTVQWHTVFADLQFPKKWKHLF